MARSAVEWIVYVLVIVGAVNWGLAAWWQDLVAMLLGAGTMAAKVVYSLVALAGLYLIYMLTQE